MKQFLGIVLMGILSLLGCTREKSDATTDSIFESLDSKHTGINFSNDLKETSKFNIISYLYYYNGSGVAIGDINNDGMEDIYFSGNQVPDQLYLNKGNLQFENITEEAGIRADNTWSTGVNMDDVNGDGWLDIYVCKVATTDANEIEHNLLYINQGDGTFKEMSKEYGLNFKGFSTQAAFFDYDQDGDLDMYLLNQNIHNVNSYGTIEKRKETDPFAGDLFYENRLKEEGRFVDVTKNVGIYNSPLGYGLGVTVADVNNDGWADIYVGNDFHENDYLYINNGNKTFTESVSSYMAHTTQFSMGVDIADVNNDGWADIFTTDMMPFDPAVAQVSAGEDSDQIKMIKKDFGFHPQSARNHFQINQQNGTFSDVAYMTKTFATDWSWSVLLQDFDNDMYADIFITNGIVKRPNNLDYINYLNEYDNKNPNITPERTKKLIENMPSEPLKNILFRHKGNLKYTDIKESFIGKPSFSTGAAYADLDNDGDLDIVTSNINEKAFVYENKTSGKSFISINLQGNDKFKVVKGSKVIVYSGDEFLTKELQTTKGIMSSSSAKLHFGLGNAKVVDSIMVIWPDGLFQKLNTSQGIDQHIVIKRLERKDLGIYKNLKPINNKSQFSILPIKHEENKYNDENAEKLIPERLSTSGPALISADLNGDGILDIFIGGARNQAPRLFLGNSNGSYSLKKTPDFESDAKYEDVDAALLDFDKDGDQDIYVVSGGSDLKELDKLLEDRIYLNNGNGVFRRIPLSLPHTNGSCVTIGDFDKDGFEDIFVGARSIPGSYGLSPFSFVLKNLQGMGIDIAYKERYGMITDAHWVDLDSDNDLDLVMCGDWMSILVLENDGKGGLSENTKEYGLADKTGLWNTLAFKDLNSDGILDIIAGNTGLNHKWTASDSLPVRLYVGDFDGNSASEPIIFYHYFSRYMPFGSMVSLTSQLPVLKKKFTSYSSFKNTKGIEDLFANYKENVVETKIITELRSMVFISKGKTYNAYPLNLEEQMSDIMDIEISKGGEIYYVGNFRDYISDLGISASNSGRKLGVFNKVNNTFGTSQKLHLPVDANPRKIKSFGNNKWLIANNNENLNVISDN
jgi:enediyne biosynthesis protein E4